MTYNVFGGTLSPTQSINQPAGDADPVITATLESALDIPHCRLHHPTPTFLQAPAAVIADDSGILDAKIIETAPAVADDDAPGCSVLDSTDEADLCGACKHFMPPPKKLAGIGKPCRMW